MNKSFSVRKSIAHEFLDVFIYGVLLFSYTSLMIFTISDNYYAELPILLLLIIGAIFGSPLGKLIINSLAIYRVPLIAGVVIIVGAFIIGYFNRWSLIASYADMRSNFLTFIMFFVGAHAVQSKAADQIIRLALFCSLVAVINWFYLYLTGSLGIKFQVPIMAGLVVIAADSTNKRAGIVSYVALLFVAWLAAVSFYRGNWIYPISGLGLILISGNRKEQTSNLMLLALLVLSITIVAAPFLNEFYNSSESLRIQSILKAQDIILYFQGVSELSDSDSLRMGYFVYAAYNWLDLFFPHGLGSRAFYGDIGDWFSRFYITANTADSVLFFIIFHYGLVVAVPLLLFVASIFVRFANSYGLLRSVLLSLPFISAILFDGGSLLVIQRSLWFGLYLGCIYGMTGVKNMR